jgi:serine phosphatase RsbU (regulator of sigma subunit)
VFGDILLRAAGPLAPAYADVDWAATAAGAPATWSPAVRNAAILTLSTRFPVTLLIGPEFVMVYNDAYAELIDDKHPAALGARAHDVFPEAWDTIGPMMEGVASGTGAIWFEDASVPLVRHGFLEECYFTFSYSPVFGADGTIEGVLDIATDTTRQVLDRRRLLLLSRLGEQLGDLQHPDEVPRRALPLLRENVQDLPAVDVRVPGASPEHADAALPAAPRTPLGSRPVLVEETADGRIAWLPLGPRPGAGRPAAEHADGRPVLVVRLSRLLAADEDYLGFLQLVAVSLSQALDRVTARATERDAVEAQRSMSEALQRSLLTPPLEPDHLEVAVRYLPAAEQAQIGGDWYDSFMLPDGSLTLVIGDVAGHDQLAAAAMAQVRNLLRGVSFTLQKPPARVMGGLDDAMHGLAVDVSATAIIAQVEQDEEQRAAGVRTLRWSNAGHPPPVLLGADGSARLLASPPNLVLGLATGNRTDHTVLLQPGSAVVFYTDGLVERRDRTMQERWDWLLEVLTGQQELGAEELCDHVLDRLDDGVDDDIALMAVRAYPQDRPRPPKAGPEVLPEHLRGDVPPPS